VRGVTVGAGDALVCMDRCAPARAWSALALLMALHADLGSLGRRKLFEIQNGAWLFATRGQVLTPRAVALFAGLTSVHVVLK